MPTSVKLLKGVAVGGIVGSAVWFVWGLWVLGLYGYGSFDRDARFWIIASGTGAGLAQGILQGALISFRRLRTGQSAVLGTVFSVCFFLACCLVSVYLPLLNGSVNLNLTASEFFSLFVVGLIYLTGFATHLSPFALPAAAIAGVLLSQFLAKFFPSIQGGNH